MHADLWGWFSRFTAQAYLNNDVMRQRLPRLYDSGWEHLRAERPDEALVSFSEGLTLATKLDEPCWELFFDYWCAETYVFYKADYITGLDRSVKVVARAHQTRYQQCPVRARVYYTLMYIYYLLDSVGYEDKIREMADFITAEIPMDDDTEQRVQYIRAGLSYALEHYDTAEEETMSYLDMTGGNPHRQAGGYNLLRRIAFARGQIGQAFDYGYQVEQKGRQARLQSSVAHALLWQAVYARRLGQLERAEGLLQQGIAHHQRYQLPRLGSYYDALCDYYELCEEHEKALELRQEQIQTADTVGSIDYSCYALLQYCRLLGRMRMDITTALQSAYALAAQLLRPQLYLDKLKRIEAGDYSVYDWQKGIYR